MRAAAAQMRWHALPPINRLEQSCTYLCTSGQPRARAGHLVRPDRQTLRARRAHMASASLCSSARLLVQQPRQQRGGRRALRVQAAGSTFGEGRGAVPG